MSAAQQIGGLSELKTANAQIQNYADTVGFKHEKQRYNA